MVTNKSLFRLLKTLKFSEAETARLMSPGEHEINEMPAVFVFDAAELRGLKDKVKWQTKKQIERKHELHTT